MLKVKGKKYGYPFLMFISTLIIFGIAFTFSSCVPRDYNDARKEKKMHDSTNINNKASEANDGIKLPHPDEISEIIFEERSIAQWYTRNSLLEALPKFEPHKDFHVYAAKLPFQWGKFVLNNRQEIQWSAADANSIQIEGNNKERLFHIPKE